METEINRMVDRFTRGQLTRRQLIAGLFGLVTVAAGSKVARAESGESSTPFEATALDHIALRVTDVPRSRDFYRDHLGLTVTRDGGESSCFLSFDKGFLALFRGEEARMDHYCYAVKNYDVQRAEEKLRAAGLTPRVRGGRIYFDDPDGLEVQLAAEQE